MSRRSIHTLIAAVVIGLLVMPTGGASAASVNKQFKRQVSSLQKQVRTLQKQLKTLQGQSGSGRAPLGPAGGDLTGTFPNPVIGPNAVGSAEIADNAVTAAEIAANAVTGAEIADNAVTGTEIANGAVKSDDLAENSVDDTKIADGTVKGSDLANGAITSVHLFNGSVGARQLNGVTTAVSSGTSIGAGQFGSASVSCPNGKMLIAGGYAWQDTEANSIISSAPSEASPKTAWLVKGLVPSGGTGNALYAWATCLDV